MTSHINFLANLLIEAMCYYFQEIDLLVLDLGVLMLVLDPVVLMVANLFREKMFSLPHRDDNTSLRSAAYRQFIMWRHGKAGCGMSYQAAASDAPRSTLGYQIKPAILFNYLIYFSRLYP